LTAAGRAASGLGIEAQAPTVVTARTLIAELSRLAGRGCPACGVPLCGHELLVSIAAGFRREPRCAACLAGALARDAQGFRQHVVSYIRHRDCYLGAWRWASGRECACAAASEMGPAALDIADELATEAGDHGEHQEWATEWDAGDLACGDLVLELRQRLAAMQPGAVVRVVARDPGAPADLPAWCRMTGHRLVLARHPEYAIERRRT